MHCLLFLSQDSDYTNRDLINRIVWAELPDEELDPTDSLTELVKTHMLHGPCGNIDPECVCMKDKNDGRGRRCKASYPNTFKKKLLYKKMDTLYIVAEMVQVRDVNG